MSCGFSSDLLNGLNTHVVVPLLPKATAPDPAIRLDPIFEMKGQTHVMATQFMAAVPGGVLNAPISNLEDHFTQIAAATDKLMQGFRVAFWPSRNRWPEAGLQGQS
ncbi:CcdB family protein [uncultured Ruegeria sp.]|uniref:CcdB family protein n=1 Tax=uncultured Ruegeria sp. TaxID=259304 RepID=UPI00262BF0BA|nr:CcdB family protein [uncultured Ruegeria sp.]